MKKTIIFLLATTMIAGALVFDGASRLRSSNHAVPPNVVKTLLPTDGSNNGSNGQTETQPAVSSDPTKSEAEAGQNAASDSDAQQTGDANSLYAAQPAPIQRSPAQTRIAVSPYAAKPDAGQNVVVPVGATADSDTTVPAPQRLAVATAATTDTAPAKPVLKRRVVVPAGTILTVTLAEQLGSQVSEAGQSFSATLDRDVVVGGKTVIAAGAAIIGKVAAARPVGELAGEPNLQLKLASINVNNADLKLVTSVRSFGSQIKGKNKVSRFMKGLVKRYQHEESEVVLEEQSACSFTLQAPVQIQ